MARYLALCFQDGQGITVLTETLDGKARLAVYAKETVDAFRGEPAFAGYASVSAESPVAAEAAAIAKLGLWPRSSSTE